MAVSRSSTLRRHRVYNFAPADKKTVNQMRASRIAQVMEDFRGLQHHIAQVKYVHSEHEKDGEGYKLLRECTNEGRDILKAPFSASSEPPQGNLDEEKVQLMA